ncbi:DVU0298 family protein [candidate division KSB1 bacterium]
MSRNKELELLLKNNDLDKIEEMLTEKPQHVRRLMGYLYDPDEDLRMAAAKCFGIAARILPMEKLKDLIRRMMWMLNDESGSSCWHVPYALGEIGYANYEAIRDFLPCLEHYTEDPDHTLSKGVKDAFERIRQSGEKLEIGK